MSVISLDRPRSSAPRTVLIAASILLLLGGALVAATPAKTAAPSASAPKISVAGFRIVGNGLGANGSELHAFNESPGTTICLAIEAPEGSGIVEIDEDHSRLDAISDNKGNNLLQEGRFGSFPKISEDHTAALAEIEVKSRPPAGASSLTAQGTVAMTVANGTKATKVPNVKLEPAKTMKIGNSTVTIKTVTPGDESTDIEFALQRSFMNTIREVRFLDAKGEVIESHRSGSGYMNDDAEMSFTLKTKDKVVTPEFDVWQNTRPMKVPFKVTVGLGLGGDSQASTPAAQNEKAAAAPARPPAPPRPPTMPGPNEGANTVDAVVSQMQTAASASKGKELLSVIYPDDRATFGQAVAMMATFSTLGNMKDAKASEKAQKDIDALFAKHKLKMPLMTQEPADIFKNSDLAAFVSDTMAYLKAHTPKGSGDPLPIPKGRAQDVTVDGDSATAKVGDKELKFARLNNKWFVRLTD